MNKFGKFYISQKTDVNFNNINKSMFEHLRDIEIAKLNKLDEQYCKLLTSMATSNNITINEEMNFDNLLESLLKASDKPTIKKIKLIKNKRDKTKKNYLVEELVMNEEELEETGFYDKHPELK